MVDYNPYSIVRWLHHQVDAQLVLLYFCLCHLSIMHSLNYLFSEGKMMDHGWMSLSRSSLEYKIALNAFLDDYFAKIAIGNQICCPYKKC